LAPAPDYDKKFLQPLHAAQAKKAIEDAAKAAEAAREAARIAEQQRADQLAAEQAKAAQIAAEAARVPTFVSVPSVATVQGGVQDSAKAFIYSHESGNNPASVNASSGACGLGQALPCSKMPCSLSDYACQDNFFTQYCLSRYGTWDAAMAFWQAHSWW
jgi:hypothetical protein